MTSDTTSLKPFDPASALAHLDGDAELLSVIVDSFREDCPRMLAAMQQAVDSDDAGTLKLAAHEFKGAVSNFSEPRTVELARALELLGDRGTLGGAAAILAQLRIAVEELQACLTAFLARLPACAP